MSLVPANDCPFCAQKLAVDCSSKSKSSTLKRHLKQEHSSALEDLISECPRCGVQRDVPLLMNLAGSKICHLRREGASSEDLLAPANEDSSRSSSRSICSICQLFEDTFFCVLRQHKGVCTCWWSKSSVAHWKSCISSFLQNYLFFVFCNFFYILPFVAPVSFITFLCTNEIKYSSIPNNGCRDSKA